MDQSERPTIGGVREATEDCTAPHPLLGLGVTLVLAGIVGALAWLLIR